MILIEQTARLTHLISRQQTEVIRRIGDNIAFAAGITGRGGVSKPVQADAEHPVSPERGYEQVPVLSRLAELR